MIKIICVGKIKEEYFRNAVKEYEKRLSKYTKLEIIECPDYGNLEITTILEKEKEEILKHIQEKDYLITLEIEGKELDSVSFAEKIEKTLVTNSNITFIIGGSYGIHEEIKQKSDFHLSFSKMTFPHQLFRILLLEQIYRSFKIRNHESYHK